MNFAKFLKTPFFYRTTPVAASYQKEEEEWNLICLQAFS